MARARLQRTAPLWNEADSIRETTLQHFPDERDRDALRHVGRLIYDLAVEADSLAVETDTGRPETSSIHCELLAILLDLRSLGGYAAMVGRMAEGSSLPPADDALARFAGKVGKQLGATADAIAERLSRPLASPASHRSTSSASVASRRPQ